MARGRSLIGFGAMLVGIAVSNPAISVPLKGNTQHHRTVATKPPTIAYYSGEHAGNGAYVALQSSSEAIWQSVKNDDGKLEKVIDSQIKWNIESNIQKFGAESERTERQAVADLAFASDSASRLASYFDAQMSGIANYTACAQITRSKCKFSTPKLKLPSRTIVRAKPVRLPPEPAASMPSIGDTNLDGLRKGYVRHVAGPKPEGWDDMVDAGRALWHRGDEIGALKVVNDYTKRCDYYRRALDPQNKVKQGHPWFSEWTQTPYFALETDIGCDCRDNAAMTFYGLVAIGVPMDRLATALLLMSSSPQQGPATKDGDIVHVLTLVKTSQGKTVVLNQSEREGRSLYVVGTDRFALGTKGLLSVGNLAGGRSFGPVYRDQPVLLASKSGGWQ